MLLAERENRPTTQFKLAVSQPRGNNPLVESRVVNERDGRVRTWRVVGGHPELVGPRVRGMVVRWCGVNKLVLAGWLGWRRAAVDPKRSPKV